MSGFKSNTAVTGFAFALVSATDGSAITTGTVTGYYLLDGVTQAAIAGTPVHEGNGQWSVSLTAAEMNGAIVGLLFTHASAIPVHFTIKTDTRLVSELNNLSAANVNAEVVDVLVTDTFDEPGIGVPGVNISLKEKIGYIYKFLRNKKTSTASQISVFSDDESTVDHKSILSDDGTTYTESEFISGP